MKDAQVSKSGVHIFHDLTWDEFAATVRQFDGRDRIFRGHGDAHWKLSSRYERWLWQIKGGIAGTGFYDSPGQGDYRNIRQEYLDRFKELAIGLPGIESKALSTEDWWALGRHYGLITPLLDWTRSPYIAAFFAYLDYAEQCNPGFQQGLLLEHELKYGQGVVAIWAIIEANSLIKGNEFNVLKPLIDFSHHTQRVRAQGSVFTMLDHDRFLDIESYVASRKDGGKLERYEIRGSELGTVLNDLRLMNITLSILFPDLGGAAGQTNLERTLESLAFLSKASDPSSTGNQKNKPNKKD